jgi:hypothetical protein
MAEREEIDLAYRLLDLDLIDSEDRRCGKVDDIEFEGGPGEAAYVSAVRSGLGALPPRFPRLLRRGARRVFGATYTAVPSAEIEDVAGAVTLAKTAEELDLGEGDRRLVRLLEHGGRA